MRKIATLIISFMLIFMILGCKWTMPEGIKIRGKVGVNNLAVNFNLSNEISKAIKDQIKFDPEGDYTITVQECVNAAPINGVDVFTLLVHLNIPIDDFEMPADADFVKDIDENIDDWLENEYTEYASGDVNDFIDAQIEQLSDDLVGDKFDWDGTEITIPPDWKDKLKQDLKDSVQGETDPEVINEIITNTIQEAAAEIILDTPVTMKSGEAVEYSFDSFEIDPINISDFLDFNNIKTDNFKAGFYLSVKEKNGPQSDFLNGINLEFILGIKKIFDNEPITTGSSGIDKSSDIYSGSSLPSGGNPIEFDQIIDSGLFSNSEDPIDTEINFEIAEKEFKLADFSKEYELSVEMVLWLPLSITAKNTYEFKIPLDIEDDLFGRDPDDSMDLDNYIQGAGIELIFNESVFPNTAVVIRNVNGNAGAFEKNIALNNKSMKIDFDDNDLIELNKQVNNPFIPEIFIQIGQNGGITIPKNLVLEKFSLYADIYLKEDF